MNSKEFSPVSDLVERLRSTVGYSPYNIGYSLVAEIADRLTALEAENARYKADIDQFMQRLGARWFLEQNWFPGSAAQGGNHGE